MLDPDTYPDPHEINADPKPCLQGCESAFNLCCWIRIRIQEGQNDSQKLKKVKNFHVLKCWMFPLEGWRLVSCSLCVLYGGLRISKLQFSIQKIYNSFTAVNFFNFCSSKPRIRNWIRIRHNNWGKCWILSALNNCGSTTLQERHSLFSTFRSVLRDPWHFATDPDLRIRTSDYRILLRLEILLFSSVTFKMAKKKILIYFAF